VMTDDERRKLVSTEQSLSSDTEPKIPSSISGLETFTLSGNDDDEDDDRNKPLPDADSFFTCLTRAMTKTRTKTTAADPHRPSQTIHPAPHRRGVFRFGAAHRPASARNACLSRRRR